MGRQCQCLFPAAANQGAPQKQKRKSLDLTLSNVPDLAKSFAF